MSNTKILKERVELKVIKLIIKPTTAKNARNWSMLPKSNSVNKSQKKNGTPIICPVKMIKRYETIEIDLNALSCFTLIFFLLSQFFKLIDQM